MQGALRAPRTRIGESCGSLQYKLSGVSRVVVSAGLRHILGGRKTALHGTGSLTVMAKSPSAHPVLFSDGETAWIPAIAGGSITRICSSDAWYTTRIWPRVVRLASNTGSVGLMASSRRETSSNAGGPLRSTVRNFESSVTNCWVIPDRLRAQVLMESLVSA